MQIEKGALEEFRAIYRDEFGEELSVDEAQEMASNLIDLYELLMQPLPRELEDTNQKRDQTAPHTPSR